MSDATRLGPGDEFDTIRKMIEAAGHSAAHIGDDAAVLDMPSGEKLVVSTDTSVENVHFKREWMTFEEIAYRATAAALSDLAAMAASPAGVLVSYAVPTRDSGALEDLARGAGAAAAGAGTAIIGGDISSSDTIAITATVLGTAARPLLRSGAMPGDVVYVTGVFGGPWLALTALKAGEKPSPSAREKFVKPIPRIKEALWLAREGASACIDVSDGLAGELRHIAAASRVQINVAVQSIPHFDGVTFREALMSGEEYELCVTMPEEVDTREFASLFGIPLTLIGDVHASPTPEVSYRASASFGSLESFNHFANDHQ